MDLYTALENICTTETKENLSLIAYVLNWSFAGRNLFCFTMKQRRSCWLIKRVHLFLTLQWLKFQILQSTISSALMSFVSHLIHFIRILEKQAIPLCFQRHQTTITSNPFSPRTPLALMRPIYSISEIRKLHNKKVTIAPLSSLVQLSHS